ncbi:2-dehydropantoate 2-reductase [Robertmurraya andreesenii]|uniref:2-dehydropantoate 2-reductase n=1 Tax=Anoxybacillus andreesenii TaxID=1325932 RepID=A0ABT9V4P3_9BACL|nr:2-dehydropantoate 2-reductase [Robertmurraya andreesenii]MDQ0155906.1 2-dehydropantoate 2-reductase [Robertmurraya andreesenii]
MKIAIVGGGAIGLLFSFYLNQHHEVVLYVRNIQQRDRIQAKGIHLTNHQGSFSTKVEVRLASEWGKGGEDLSIICVKQYHLQSLLENKKIEAHHPLLFLQNGMGHLEYIDRLNLRFVLVGAVEHGAYRTDDDSVVHKGEGQTRIAFYKGADQEFLDTLIKPFHQSFPFQKEDDFKEMLQKKLVVNAIINPLTALLKVQNGALIENPHFFQTFRELFVEIKGILRLEKEELYYQNVVEVCRNTSQNRSSMLKDVEEGRPTEIDAILGYLIKQANEKNMQAPLINALFHLIKGNELEKGGK